jgi:hypothetical protein
MSAFNAETYLLKLPETESLGLALIQISGKLIADIIHGISMTNTILIIVHCI